MSPMNNCFPGLSRTERLSQLPVVTIGNSQKVSSAPAAFITQRTRPTACVTGCPGASEVTLGYGDAKALG